MKPVERRTEVGGRDPAERLLESALEERFSDEQAPDLRHRILSASPQARREAAAHADLAASHAPRRRSTRLPAAAMLLAGFGLLWLIAELRSSGGEADQGVGSEALVFRPADAAEFEQLLAQVEKISIRSLFSREKAVDLSAGPGGLIEIDVQDQVTNLKTAMLASTEARPVAGWNWLHRIGMHLPDGRMMHASLYMFGERRWAVDGLGDLRASEELSSALRPLIAKAELGARRRQGIVFGGAELKNSRSFDSALNKLVCFDLEDEDLSGLARFSKLAKLDLSGSAAKLSPDALAKGPILSELRELRLRQGTVSNALLESFSKLPKLEILDLSGTAWSPSTVMPKPAKGSAKPSPAEQAKRKEQATKEQPGGAFSAFVALGNLRELDLSYSDLRSDLAMRALSRMPSLQRVLLRGRESAWLTKAGLRALADSSSIEELDLRDLTCDMNAGFDGWPGFDSLRVLYLGSTDVDASGVSKMPPGLLELDLTRCRQLGDASLAAIARLRSLRSLSLQDTGVSAKSLAALGVLGELRQLNLRGLAVTGEETGWLGKLTGLRKLDLGFTLADDPLLESLAQMPDLQELILVACDGFGDGGLAALAAARKLLSINLKLCDGFSDEALDRFRAALPDCQVLR
ncbi:MAG: leucine-rich repeat domain-containing protein [Planctomycetota bacterium]|jgi:Leucine-rich repeat (LRR) protein